LIPAAHINAWRQTAPWFEDNQVEQDLILSRLIVEIANDETLGPELAFRGGTCLHKLHLPEPLRYSEDLDYVRRTHSGIKPYLAALHSVAERVGLAARGTKQSGGMVHAVFDAEPTSGAGRIRVKIETNIVETDSYLPRIGVSYGVDSPWWSGSAEVSTFALEELLGTKLRALYQRSKGRDLFDLWFAITELDLAADEVANAFHHYMEEDAFSFPELAQNLRAKLADPDFHADVEQLTAVPSNKYEPEAAADLLMECIGRYLRNAPKLDEIKAGQWRD
jgi:predicted nucleotidyltransferase component of viral defense system